jgi:hypothetical protein
MLDKPIPLFSVDLIKELEASISSVFNLDDNDRTIGFKIGQRQLIDSLLLRLKLQEETVLKGNLIT